MLSLPPRKLTFWETNLLRHIERKSKYHDEVDIFFYQPIVIRSLEDMGLIETNLFKDCAQLTDAGRKALANLPTPKYQLI